jgi:hypothetical protein
LLLLPLLHETPPDSSSHLKEVSGKSGEAHLDPKLTVMSVGFAVAKDARSEFLGGLTIVDARSVKSLYWSPRLTNRSY